MLKQSAFVLVIAGAAVALPDNANAAVTDPDLTFPGAMCRMEYNQEGATPGIFFAENKMINLSGSSRSVTCPIVRKDPDNTTGHWVAVYVRNPVTCTLYSNPPVGDYFNYLTGSSTSSGDGVVYLFGLHSSYSWGNANLACTVPHGSWIYSYFVWDAN
jgi:hypothetical protein